MIVGDIIIDKLSIAVTKGGYVIVQLAANTNGGIAMGFPEFKRGKLKSWC